MAEVNTPDLEYAMAISRDQREMIFTRVEGSFLFNDPGLYRSVRKSVLEPFDRGTKIKAVTGYVEGATFSPDELSLYYHKKEGDRFSLFRVSRVRQTAEGDRPKEREF